ncbi:hypothetical protein FIBSPDRAFT_782267 [Athelia psychrophila]|uniref:Uncharacterized protein n=1 Tax=Athelia psychrophila TaxID=1759441 RepID=A0A166PQT5_9AGAM|nr:hypothetical protein FIBSPDRAFT_782267 [Fibularhizoctonia sp. CBS 109695]
MKFSTVALSVATLIATASGAPTKRDVDASLVPQFGLAAGLNPDGTGNCDGINGANGKPILIPCACPPDRDTFIASLNANVAAGHAVNNPSVAVTFPSGSDTASQTARIDASLVTLQNLNGSGQGCPASSTTFSAQQAAIAASGATAAAPPAAAAPAPSASAPTASSAPATAASSAPAPAASSDAGGVNAALVPQFGLAAGLNPDGNGNCDGVNGPNGQPILIPCACPPDRDTFIASLNANVAAGHAVNNPSVAVTFPTGSDTASQSARIEASLVTLQNLNGSGVGCPASSTTFVAQQQALTRRKRRSSW